MPHNNLSPQILRSRQEGRYYDAVNSVTLSPNSNVKYNLSHFIYHGFNKYDLTGFNIK
jgi:hypothetical protein